MSATSDAAFTPLHAPRHAAAGGLRLVERLHEVVACINSDAGIDTVLQRICAAALDLVDADLSMFLRLDGRHWRPTVVRRDQATLACDHVPVHGDDWVAQLVRDGGGWCAFPVDDVSPVVAGVVDAVMPAAGTGMVAAVRASGQAHGALVVVYADGKRTPEPAEIDVLVLLAEHAGVAVTHAKSSAEMVRGQQHQHVIVEATEDGLAVLDGDGLVLQWNRSAVRLTGVPADEVVGKPPPFPVSEPGQVLDHRLPSGRWLEILTSTVPESDDLVVEFRDVSSAKELERAKDLFLATAAHELRTPVTAIHGFASTLLHRWEDLADTGRRSAVEVVAERSAALASVVDKVVVGSTVAGQDAEVSPESLDLVVVLGEILAGQVLPPGQHRVVLDVPDEAPLARGDSRAVAEIVRQLLENAVKFSPDGGDVVIRLWNDDAHVGFTVRDEGIGIDPADHDRVFELFYQGCAGDRRRFGGLGLGLYIVRQLVRAQGGTVSTSPAAGRGTEMRVGLPRVTPA